MVDATKRHGETTPQPTYEVEMAAERAAVLHATQRGARPLPPLFHILATDADALGEEDQEQAFTATNTEKGNSEAQTTLVCPVRWTSTSSSSRAHEVFHRCNETLRRSLKNIDNVPFGFRPCRGCTACDAVKLRQASHPQRTTSRLLKGNVRIVVDIKEIKPVAIIPHARGKQPRFSARWAVVMVVVPFSYIETAITEMRGAEAIAAVIAFIRRIRVQTKHGVQAVRWTDSEGGSNTLKQFCDEIGAELQTAPTGEAWSVSNAEVAIKTIFADAEASLLPDTPAEFKSYALLDKTYKHNMLTQAGEKMSIHERMFDTRPDGRFLLPSFCATNYIDSRRSDRRKKQDGQAVARSGMVLCKDATASTWGRALLIWDLEAGRERCISYDSCVHYPDIKLGNVLGSRGTHPDPARVSVKTENQSTSSVDDTVTKTEDAATINAREMVDNHAAEALSETFTAVEKKEAPLIAPDKTKSGIKPQDKTLRVHWASPLETVFAPSKRAQRAGRRSEHRDGLRREFNEREKAERAGEARRRGTAGQNDTVATEEHLAHVSETPLTVPEEIPLTTVVSTSEEEHGNDTAHRLLSDAERDAGEIEADVERAVSRPLRRSARLRQSAFLTPQAALAAATAMLDNEEGDAETTPPSTTPSGEPEEDKPDYPPLKDLPPATAAILQAAVLASADAHTKVLDLGTGTGSFRTEFLRRGAFVFSIDKDRKTPADLHACLLEFDARVIPIVFDVVVITMNCHTHSYGTHKHRRAGTAIPKTKAAGLADFLTAKIMTVIAHFQAINPNLKVVWESPVGHLQKSPVMELGAQLIGLKREMVYYCNYGCDYKKPTHIWTNLDQWTPIKPRCRHGAHARGHRRYIPPAEFAVNPPRLVAELAEAVARSRLEERPVQPRPSQDSVFVGHVADAIETDPSLLRRQAETARAVLGHPLSPTDGFVGSPGCGGGAPTGAGVIDTLVGSLTTDAPIEDRHVICSAFASMEEDARRLSSAVRPRVPSPSDTPVTRSTDSGVPTRPVLTKTRSDADDDGGWLMFDNFGIPDEERKKVLTKAQVAASPEAQAAQRAEMASLHRLGAFDAKADNSGYSRKEIADMGGVKLPGFMVNTIKMSGKHKGRFVIGGNAMPPELATRDKTTSSTVTPASVNIMHSIAAALGYDLFTVDVNSAYLFGRMPDYLRVFVHIPAQFADVVPYAGRYVRVVAALYGAPQSGRIWWLLASSTLAQCGFVRHEKDLCIFRKRIDHALLLEAGYKVIDESRRVYERREGGKTHRFTLEENMFVLACLYVDDMRTAAPSEAIARAALRPFLDRFSHKVQPLSALYLGGETTALPDGSYVRHYERAIRRAAEKFHTHGRRRYSPFFDPDIAVTRGTPEEHEKAKHLPYRELVGTLLWFACGLRSDILCAVCTLCQFSACWTEAHFIAAMQVLCYLETTADYGPHYRRDVPIILELFVDAAYANAVDGRTIGGYVVLLGGTIIAAATRIFKRPLVSTAESEIYSAWAGIQSALYFRDLLEFAGFPQGATPLHIDNNAALRFVADQPKVNARNAHIETRFWRAHYEVMENNLAPVYVESAKNAADGVSKLLRKENTRRFHELCNMASASALLKQFGR
jgi:hypothetical protein